MRSCKLTVFTPTYNRAYILPQLYASLQRQRFTDFEWLVVDDGSTDQTSQLFSKWITEEKPFTIRYIYQPNGGKHRAVNHGLKQAYGEYFMVMDSDDYLTDEALEKIAAWLDTISTETQIIGITANKGTSSTETPNALFTQPFLDKSLLEMNTFEQDGKKVLAGERVMVFRTDVHLKYLYPEYDGEKFLTEAVAYNRMAHDGYIMRFYNDIIWIYEYQEDGLTRAGNSIFLRNPRGYGLWRREEAVFLHKPILSRLFMYYSFTCELSHLYDAVTIAQCIGVSEHVIRMAKHLHRIMNILNRLLHNDRKQSRG